MSVAVYRGEVFMTKLPSNTRWNHTSAAGTYKAVVAQIRKKFKKPASWRPRWLEDNDPVQTGRKLKTQKAALLSRLEFPRRSPDAMPLDRSIFKKAKAAVEGALLEHLRVKGKIKGAKEWDKLFLPVFKKAVKENTKPTLEKQKAVIEKIYEKDGALVN